MQLTPKIGLRTLKTALAIFLCLLLFPDTPFFACITAVFCIQDTVSNSFKMAFVRGFGTIWGGLIGLTFLYICYFIKGLNLPSLLATPIIYGIISLGIIVVIHSLNLLKRPTCITIGCIVFLAITTANADKTPLLYTANRVVETLFGILIGLLVNRFITPPKEKA